MCKLLLLLLSLPLLAQSQTVSEVHFIPIDSIYLVVLNGETLVNNKTGKEYLGVEANTTYYASSRMDGNPARKKTKVSFSFRSFKTFTVVSGDELLVTFIDGSTGLYKNKALKMPVDSGNTASIDFTLPMDDKLSKVAIKHVEVKTSQVDYHYDIPLDKSDMLLKELKLIEDTLKKQLAN